MPGPHGLFTADPDPDADLTRDMDDLLLSQIKLLACAIAGGAAGHANAVCVSACCEGAGASVCYARDASVPSTSPTLGQVAARHLRTRVGRI